MGTSREVLLPVRRTTARAAGSYQPRSRRRTSASTIPGPAWRHRDRPTKSARDTPNSRSRVPEATSSAWVTSQTRWTGSGLDRTNLTREARRLSGLTPRGIRAQLLGAGA